MLPADEQAEAEAQDAMKSTPFSILRMKGARREVSGLSVLYLKRYPLGFVKGNYGE